jgi:hypothetical protein
LPRIPWQDASGLFTVDPVNERAPAVSRRVTYTTRCPFCHDVLPRGGVQCGVCGARHHTACIDEAPQCATCGEDLTDKVHRALIRAAEERNRFWVRWFPSRRYHHWYQRNRQWAYRPLALAAAAGVIGLLLVIEAIARRL